MADGLFPEEESASRREFLGGHFQPNGGFRRMRPRLTEPVLPTATTTPVLSPVRRMKMVTSSPSQTDFSRVARENEDLETGIDALLRRFQAKSAELSGMNDDLAHLKSSVSRLGKNGQIVPVEELNIHMSDAHAHASAASSLTETQLYRQQVHLRIDRLKKRQHQSERELRKDFLNTIENSNSKISTIQNQVESVVSLVETTNEEMQKLSQSQQKSKDDQLEQLASLESMTDRIRKIESEELQESVIGLADRTSQVEESIAKVESEGEELQKLQKGFGSRLSDLESKSLDVQALSRDLQALDMEALKKIVAEVPPSVSSDLEEFREEVREKIRSQSVVSSEMGKNGEELGQRIDALGKELSGVSERVQGLAVDVDAVAVSEEDLQSLREENKANLEVVRSLEGGQEQISKKLDSVEREFGSVVGSLRGEVSQITSESDLLRGDLNKLSDSSEARAQLVADLIGLQKNHSSEIERLDVKLRDVPSQASLDDLKDASSRVDSSVTGLRDELQGLVSRTKGVEERLGEYESLGEMLPREAVDSALGKYRERLDSLIQDLNQMRSLLQEQKSDHADIAKIARDFESQGDRLESLEAVQLESIRSQEAKMEELAEKTRDVAELCTLLNGKQMDFSKGVSSLETQTSGFSEELADVSSRLQSVELEQSGLHETSEEMTTHVSQVRTALEGKLKALSERSDREFSVIQTRFGDLLAKCEDLSTDSGLESRVTDVDKRCSLVESAQGVLTGMQQENAGACKRLHEQVSDLQGSCDDVRTHMTGLQRELSEKTDSLSTAIDGRASELKKDLDGILEVSEGNFRSDLREHVKEVNDVLLRFEASLDEVKSAVPEADWLVPRLRPLHDGLQALESQVKSLEQPLTSASDVEALRTEMDALLSRFETVEDNSARIQKDLTGILQANETSDSQLGSLVELQKKMDDTTKSVDTLKRVVGQSVEGLRKECSDCGRRVTLLSEDRESELEERKRALSQVDSLQDTLSASRTQLETLGRDYDALMLRLKKLEMGRTAADRSTAPPSTQELTRLQRKVDALSSQFEGVRAAIPDSQSDIGGVIVGLSERVEALETEASLAVTSPRRNRVADGGCDADLNRLLEEELEKRHNRPREGRCRSITISAVASWLLVFFSLLILDFFFPVHIWYGFPPGT